MVRRKKLKKVMCEVCKFAEDPTVLDYHHIVERVEVGTSNHPMNLCILCANCHRNVHSKRLVIYGVYPSTEPPNGRTVIYELDGECNIPELKEAYYKHKPKQMKVFIDEE